MNDYTYEHEAWEAFNNARRRVSYTDPDGTVKHDLYWRVRGAPSVGAMAASILRNLPYPPSYVSRCLDALALYLSDVQRAERSGFDRPRRGLSLT